MPRTAMSRPFSMPTGLSLAALVAFSSATLVAGIATWRAVRLDPLPTADGSPVAVRAETLESMAIARSPRGDVRPIDNDPFSADRQLPAARARAVESYASAGAIAVPPEAVRLLGTVIRPGGKSFVVYQLPSEVPKTLRLGETVGGMTLADVAPGRATFRTQRGARVELSLAKAGS
ncbi:MAG TPA: hypothetical protein VFU01_19100 [Gemmatimonadaceae bacterium]|nr:hypothetical protein [Gemmatimonadaceae bacterium]